MIYLYPMTANETQPAPEMTKQEERELLQQILKSVEQTRKMFLWTLIISIVAFALPIVGLAFAIPYLFTTYISTISTQLGI